MDFVIYVDNLFYTNFLIIKFNFVSHPNQKTSKEGEDSLWGDDPEVIDIWDFFDTSCNDDVIAGHFFKVNYNTGTLTIKGELSRKDVKKIIDEEVFNGTKEIPTGIEIMQRINLLTEEWEIDWCQEELYINGELYH